MLVKDAFLMGVSVVFVKSCTYQKTHRQGSKTVGSKLIPKWLSKGQTRSRVIVWWETKKDKSDVMIGYDCML